MTLYRLQVGLSAGGPFTLVPAHLVPSYLRSLPEGTSLRVDIIPGEIDLARRVADTLVASGNFVEVVPDDVCDRCGRPFDTAPGVFNCVCE